jgi:hypothetical protein
VVLDAIGRIEEGKAGEVSGLQEELLGQLKDAAANIDRTPTRTTFLRSKGAERKFKSTIEGYECLIHRTT